MNSPDYLIHALTERNRLAAFVAESRRFGGDNAARYPDARFLRSFLSEFAQLLGGKPSGKNTESFCHQIAAPLSHATRNWELAGSVHFKCGSSR